MIGETLGHYQILEELGAGGMGEVYRAEDLTLRREVALKVLRPLLSGSQNQLERFQREAKTLAALDHPNIVTIYSVEKVGGTNFLTMQLVKGQPLSKLIPPEGMEIRDVLEIGIALADALAAAHQQGVIHRDLKPGNIMVTEEDRVKILDFGLAKLLEDLSSSVSTQATTEDLTDQGRLIGTITYMSPEQARGEPVGTRSDIFSLGTVLYEMSTGERPFRGSNRVAVLSEILSKRPPLSTRIRPDLPPRLGKVTRTALSKRPENRPQTADELRDQLVETQRELSESESHSTSALRQLLKGSSWITVKRTQLILATSILLVAVLISTWAGRRVRSGKPRLVRVEYQEAIVTWPSREEGGSISASGDMWAFVSGRGGDPKVWLGSADSAAPRPIRSGASRYKNLVWSPDERRIAFLQESEGVATLEVISLWGGEVRPPFEFEVPIFDVGLIDWIGDSLYLYLGEGTIASLWRLDVATGTLEQVTDPDRGKIFHAPDDVVHVDISHDEKRLVFVVLEDSGTDLWVSDLDGLNPHRITNHPWRVISPRWLGPDDRWIVYLSNESGQFDIWMTDTRGVERRPLTSSPMEELNLSLSEDGTVLTVDTAREQSNLWLLRQGGKSVPVQVTNDSRKDIWPAVASESHQFIFHRSRSALRAGFSPFETEIFLSSLEAVDSEEPVLIVQDGFGGRLNRDASWLVFLRYQVVDSAPSVELWMQRAVRGRTPLLVSKSFAMSSFEIATWAWLWTNFSWGPDGDFLYFVEQDAAGLHCISRVASFEPKVGEREVLLCAGDQSRSFGDIHVSPSGEWLGYVEKGQDFGTGGEVRVENLESGRGPTTIATFGAGSDVFLKGWRSDGSLMIVRTTEGASEQLAEVLAAHPSGKPLPLGRITGAKAADIQLDPSTDNLLLARRENDVWGIFSWSPERGEPQSVIEFQVPGITVTGFGRGPEGTLVFTKKEDVRDIWRLQLENLD